MTPLKIAGLILGLALAGGCAPSADSPKRSLTYEEPRETYKSGVAKRETPRGIQRGRTNSTSNKFGRSRRIARSNSRFERRGRIGR